MLATSADPQLQPFSGLKFLYSRYFNVVVLAVFGCVFLNWAVTHAVSDHLHVDLWIYSSGSYFAQQGQNPYDVELMHQRVDPMWPDNKDLRGNNGFFLAPQALLLFAPFTQMPWVVAKVVWGFLMVGLLVLCAAGLPRMVQEPLPKWFPSLAMFLFAASPISYFVILVGQTTHIFLACVVLGQLAFLQGRKILGCFLWSIPFFKPHLAFVLVPLVWWFHGWRCLLMMLTWVGLLNMLAGLVYFGNPLFIFDYINSVSSAHKTVLFNRVAVNEQVTSWNRLMVATGGPVLELGMFTTFAGYAVLLALVALRTWWSGVKPTLSWGFALAGTGAMSCCQLLPYEQMLHALAFPYMLLIALTPRWQCKLAALGLFGLWYYSLLPGGPESEYYIWAEKLCLPIDTWWQGLTGLEGRLTKLMISHRSLGNIGLTLSVLLLGPAPWSVPRPTAGAQQEDELPSVV